MRSSIGICVAVLFGCHPGVLSNTVKIEASITTTSQHQSPTPLTREPKLQNLKAQTPITAKKLPKEAQELFQYSPNNVEVALFADMTQVKTGALWDTYGSVLEDKLNKEKTFTDFVKEANWNPLEQTSQAYVALTDLDDASSPHVVVVFRAKNTKNFLDAISKDTSTKKSKYKGNSLYTESSDDISIVFPTSDLVIVGDTAEVKEALDGTSATKDMLGLLTSANSSSGMFGAVILGKAERQDLADEVPMLANLSGFYFSLNTAKGLDFYGGAKFPTKEEANSLKLIITLALSAQEDQWKDTGLWPYFEPLKIETVLTDLTFSWKLSEKDTLALLGTYAGTQQNGNTSLSGGQHVSKLGGK
jgi:hypothetical protein